MVYGYSPALKLSRKRTVFDSSGTVVPPLWTSARHGHREEVTESHNQQGQPRSQDKRSGARFVAIEALGPPRSNGTCERTAQFGPLQARRPTQPSAPVHCPSLGLLCGDSTGLPSASHCSAGLPPAVPCCSPLPTARRRHQGLPWTACPTALPVGTTAPRTWVGQATVTEAVTRLATL